MGKMENCLSLSTATTTNKHDFGREKDMDINFNEMIAYALVYANKKETPLTICEFKELLGVHITTNHTGKMEDMASLSTACICNDRCLARMRVAGSICEGCFANRMFKMYNENFEDCFVDNFKILTSVVIPYELMPLLNYSIFRYESFGDVANEIQAENYRRLAVMNPYVTFGWWTKNYDIVKKVFDKHGKPSNVKLIVSSFMLNEQYEIEDYPYADKIFTVYTTKYLKAHPEIKINCGKKNKCFACQKCYRDNNVVYINEIKK